MLYVIKNHDTGDYFFNRRSGKTNAPQLYVNLTRAERAIKSRAATHRFGDTITDRKNFRVVPVQIVELH